MKTKHILLLSTVLYISTSLFAQDATFAKKILDEASAQIKNAPGVEATFDMTLLNKPEKQKDTYEGTILLKKEKYFVNIMNTESYYDGKNLWTYMTEEKEVNLSLPDEDEGSMTPNNIFVMYKKGFTFKYNGETKLNKIVLYDIDMFPDNKDESYFKVNIKVNKDTKNFISFESFGKDGINNIITLKKINLNKTLDDSSFIFNTEKHKDVELIDLR